MEKFQFTLTVEESKELIARAVITHENLQASLEKNKVIFKGGTTVSKISEKIVDTPLRICGRITKRGTVADYEKSPAAHTLILQNGITRNIDNALNEEFSELTPKDTFVIGVNAIDMFGNAAMMAGSNGGGSIGNSMSFIYTEGVKVIIASGLEKLIPGDLSKIIGNKSRKGVKYSYGMSVGLFPVYGEIITEIEAVKMLSDAMCQVIGAGGVDGANGSYTFEAQGEESQIEKLFGIIKDIKSTIQHVSGDSKSLEECHAICDSCKRHFSCVYKFKKVDEI